MHCWGGLRLQAVRAHLLPHSRPLAIRIESAEAPHAQLRVLRPQGEAGRVCVQGLAAEFQRCLVAVVRAQRDCAVPGLQQGVTGWDNPLYGATLGSVRE